MASLLILYAHYASASVIEEFQRLRAAAGDGWDVVVAGYSSSPEALSDFDRLGFGTRVFSREDLAALPYPAKVEATNWVTMRGSMDLVPCAIFREKPDYDHYWIVEYDVRYSGNWKTFFEALECSDADLLCTHVHRYLNNVDWSQWSTLISPAQQLDKHSLVGGFLPLTRLSNRLCCQIDVYCQAGWLGNYEVLWPTIASLGEMVIEEIGGRGAFTPEERLERFYHSADSAGGVFLTTFTAWPFFSAKSGFAGRVPHDTLWHPVKD